MLDCRLLFSDSCCTDFARSTTSPQMSCLTGHLSWQTSLVKIRPHWLHRLSHQAPQTHNETILQLLQLGPDNLGLGLIVDHRTALRMRKDSVRKHDQSGSLWPGGACGSPKQRHDTFARLYDYRGILFAVNEFCWWCLCACMSEWVMQSWGQKWIQWGLIRRRCLS